jgi:hypothetical protein
MRERDLAKALRREKLRDVQSKRRAREQSEALSLVERAASLLVAVAGVIYTLVHYPQAPPISAVVCAVGGTIALIFRRRG